MGAAAATGCAAIADLDHEYELAPAASASSGDVSASAVGSGGGGGAGGGAGGSAVGGAGGVPDGCGDGVVTEPEACDDGNTEDADGCSSDCRCYADGDPGVLVIAGPGDGHCYFLVTLDESFLNALSVCQDENVEFASITTEAERAFIAPFISEYTWIGGAYFQNEWTWVSGEPWNIKPCSGSPPACDVSVDLWVPGEPSGDNENCIEIVPDTQKFNAAPCTDVQSYLCELSP